MSIKGEFASGVGKIVAWGLHAAGRGATQLPGRVALSLDGQLLDELKHKLRKGSVVVCGTNGKTTTNNLVASAIEASGQTVVSNKVGANMLPGIVSSLLAAKKADWGVMEVDELSSDIVCSQLTPTYMLVLNLFRDQLDRAGEIDHVQDVITSALMDSPDTSMIVCADDPMCYSIARRIQTDKESNTAHKRVITFGIAEDLNQPVDRVSDARFCLECGSELDYEYTQYAHLGKFACSSCDFAVPELDFAAFDCVIEKNSVAFTVRSRYLKEDVRMNAPFGGAYMIYNLLAAFSAATLAGVTPSVFQKTIESYNPENGRLQHMEIDGKPVTLNLAKNPTGFNQNISLLLEESDPYNALFSINDNVNDGRDISWIWDIDFERLHEHAPEKIYVSGSRANDLQVRLKYAGFDSQLVNDSNEMMDDLEKDPSKVYVLTNYSALWPVKAQLEKRAG